MADVIFMKSDRDLHAALRCFTMRREFISVEVLVENCDKEEAFYKSFAEIYMKWYVESFKYRNAFICILLSFAINFLLTSFQRKNTLPFNTNPHLFKL